MPKMSVCRCAAVMCGAKAHESARFYSNSNPAAYSTGEFGEVQQMILSGASDDDVISAHPAWRRCLNAVRKAMSDSK